MKPLERQRTVRALRRQRPRSMAIRISLLALAGSSAAAFGSGFFRISDGFSARRLDNLQRFVAVELVPFPLRGQDFDAAAFWHWLAAMAWPRGLEAALNTLWLAVAAMALASTAALLAAPLSARTLCVRDPHLFGERGSSALGRLLRRSLAGAVRTALVAARAVPEYVLAFFLLAALGPGAWPAVLALALHNGGILGRLGAEVIENLESRSLGAIAQSGGGPAHLAVLGAFPQGLGRFLLYVFYRLETCVREATVLGLMGLLSLGYWIAEARARLFYDEMVFYVALGAGLVLISDALSAAVRRAVRRAGVADPSAGEGPGQGR